MKINDSKLYGRVIFGYIIVFFIIACISLIFINKKTFHPKYKGRKDNFAVPPKLLL